jgi:hypothetical protein
MSGCQFGVDQYHSLCRSDVCRADRGRLKTGDVEAIGSQAVDEWVAELSSSWAT